MALFLGRACCAFLVLMTGVMVAWGYQLKEVYDDGQVSGIIAAGEISRIVLKHDRIRLVNADDDISITNDSETGAIFVKPLDATADKPINLFVLSEKGYSYKLILVPDNVPSEQIIIMNPEIDLGRDNEEADAFEKSSPYHHTVTEIVRAMVNREALPGYTWHSASRGTRLDDVFVKERQVFQGSSLKGVLLEVKNEGDVRAALKEGMFYEPGALAVYLPSRFLEPTTVMEVIVVANNEAKVGEVRAQEATGDGGNQ